MSFIDGVIKQGCRRLDVTYISVLHTLCEPAQRNLTFILDVRDSGLVLHGRGILPRHGRFAVEATHCLHAGCEEIAATLHLLTIALVLTAAGHEGHDRRVRCVPVHPRTFSSVEIVDVRNFARFEY